MGYIGRSAIIRALVAVLALCMPVQLHASSGRESGAAVRAVWVQANGDEVSEVVSYQEEALPRYVPGEIVLKLRASPSGKTAASVVSDLAQRHGLARADLVVRKPSHPRWKAVYKADLRPGVSPVDASKLLEADPSVEWAEPNYYRYAKLAPNDTYYSSQGYLATIGAPAAWDITTGSANVVIAVVDTGVYWNHDDLRSNIWSNADDPWDYVDNDGNGYVDDVRGWDFVSVDASKVATGEDPGPRDNDPSDWHGHGTHVAGIAGAVGNNLKGVTGVCWNVRIMPLRAGYKDKSGNGVLQIVDIAAALTYAADNGAHIVNMSFGSPDISHVEKLAIDYCDAAGLLLIAAAGNSGADEPHYPAAFHNVLAVGSTDASRYRSIFSNFGLWVDLAAPGSSVYSTTADASVYGYKSGTSMASPVVAGVAGLMKAADPSLTAREIAMRLKCAAEDINALNPNYINLLGTGLARADSALSGVMSARLKTVSLWAEESIGISDGDFDAGETLVLRPSVRNSGLAQDGVSVTLTSDDPYVSIADGLCVIGAIPEDRTATSQDDALGITVAEGVPPNHIANLTFRIRVGGYPVATTDTIPLRLNPLLRNPLLLAEHGASGYIEPAMVRKPQGGLVVVYQLSGLSANVVLARASDASGNWSPAVQISPVSGVTAARDHSAAVGADGRVHVVHMGVTAYPQCELFYTSMSPVDGTWAEPIQLTNGASLIEVGARKHSMVSVDTQGRVHVIWGDRRNGTRQIFHKYLDGTTWSADAPIATTSADPAGYKLVFDQDGVGYLLWIQPSENKIYMMTLTDGMWGTPALVTQTQKDYQIHYKAFDVEVDSQGRLHLAYLWPNVSTMYYSRYENGVWSQAIEIARKLGVGGAGHVMALAPGDRPYVLRRCAPSYLQGNPIQLHEVHFDGTSWMPLTPLTFGRSGTGLGDLDLGIDSDGTVIIACDRDPIPGDGVSKSSESDLLFASSRKDPARLPSRPQVQDDGWWTAGRTSLHASWSSSHAEGIARYEYAVGTAPGEADVLWWNPAFTATSATMDMTDIPLLDGQVYYVSVRAQGNNGCWSPIGCSDGVRYIPPASTIRDAKAAPDTIAADIRNAVVTAVFADCFYIESDNRSSGIRVEREGHGLSEGMRADVAGVLDTNDEGERFIQASSASQVGSGSLVPLGLNNLEVGGGAFDHDAGSGAGQQGVSGGVGLNNIGLLVRTWGKVTRVGTCCLYVDDGSGLRDGTLSGTEENIGILVECDSTGIEPGDSVEITGVSSCFRTPSEVIARRILVTGSDDVRKRTMRPDW